ncbi:peptide/nickel transport system substrate-binding protein [Paenibacillus sp. JGP012]|uniref:nickel ABC transporter substrate-binding protein n=1 Tax=Paenibacillus sp. JGP012 TaxID=2735914 RepID=UPI001606F977|nr:nickel ABC transporter substrate-binding protein [Paenibacillus sp. JGP012]MBB6021879.1 peptide/nickel transport system substrate-binding protein [Paenibacillus sp. JGP012]
MSLWIRSQRNKVFFGFILILCTAIFLSGCSQDNGVNTSSGSSVGEKSSVASASKNITIIHSLPNDTLDPHNTWITLRGGVTETLLRLDENMKVSPWLASDWKASDDRTWVFTIREGIQFQDGTPLNAEAAKASFERGIADSKALAAALKIASIEANGQQLQITNTEPYPAFPTELVHPTTSIISVAAEKQMGKEAFNNAPVGTGPFKVTSFTPGSEMHLVRNDEYWDGKAKLDEVTFRFNADANVRTLAFQSKQADIVFHLAPEMLASIEADNELSVSSVTSLRTHYFTYNPASSNVSDHHVREALDKLIDRDVIVQDIMLGHASAANGPFNASLPFGNKEGYQKLDEAGAIQLLESAGYTKGSDGKLQKDGKPLTLKLIAFTGVNPELPLIPQVVQSEAAQAGITIEIISVEYPEVYIADHTDWDISTASYLTSPRGDGGSFLNSAYVPGGSYNPANIEVDGLEPILKELNETGDTDQRNELTQEAVKVINKALPHSYIINPNILVGINQRVTGWKPGAEEFYIVTNTLDVK